MAIKHTGNAHFIDTDPVEAPDGTPQVPDIYPYADFRSLEHVSYGLVRTTGGWNGDEIDSVEVGQYGMEPLSQFWEFGDALKEMEGGSEYVFEETPYVEVETKEQYEEVLDALDAPEEDADGWEKPGLYDFRDSPPSFQGTVEENELEDMERAADDAFDFMFQGEEWKDVYKELAESDDEEGDD